MIELNADGHSFISAGSWEEIFALPGFTDTLDVKTTKIGGVLGRYSLPTEHPCLITSCHQPHKRGFIVSIGDGRVTIIGNVCGKRHFGDDFKRVRDAYTQAVNALRFRENISAKQRLIPNWLDTLRTLREGEQQADYCYRKMRDQMTRFFDERTTKALKRKAKAADPRVFHAVELTEDEKELSLGTGRETQYRTETLFIINGLKAANDYAKLSPRRLEVLADEIEAFKHIDADSLSYKDLRARNSWCNRIDTTFRELADTVTDCQRFLVPQNLAAIRNYKSYVLTS